MGGGENGHSRRSYGILRSIKINETSLFLIPISQKFLHCITSHAKLMFYQSISALSLDRRIDTASLPLEKIHSTATAEPGQPSASEATKGTKCVLTRYC
jgi:hypothetical protein